MKVIVHVQKFVDVAARGADINAYALVGRGIKAGSMVSAKLAETNGSIIGMLSQNIPKSKKFFFQFLHFVKITVFVYLYIALNC